jgi:hypothetical protein
MYVNDYGMDVQTASNKALEYIDARRSLIESTHVIPKPTKVGGAFWGSEEQINQAKDQAYLQLKKLYEEDGVTSQKEMRDLLLKGTGWSKEEANKIVERVLKDNNRKPLGPKPKSAPQVSPQDQEDDALLFG